MDRGDGEGLIHPQRVETDSSAKNQLSDFIDDFTKDLKDSPSLTSKLDFIAGKLK